MELIDQTTKQILLQRLQQRYESGDLKGVFMIGQYYSPEDMIREAQSGSTVGEQILIAEKKLHDELLKLGGIA